MKVLSRKTAILALLVALFVACPAAAQQTNAPPGNSAVDEYLETVPSATGSSRPRTPGSGGTSNGGLTAAQRTQLERRGPDGKALADAIDATSPDRSTGAGSTSSTGSVSSAEGRSPISEVFDVAAGRDGGAGMGVLLPAILLASLLGFVALVVMRRRSAS